MEKIKERLLKAADDVEYDDGYLYIADLLREACNAIDDAYIQGKEDERNRERPW